MQVGPTSQPVRCDVDPQVHPMLEVVCMLTMRTRAETKWRTQVQVLQKNA